MGWVLRVFKTRDPAPMPMIFKSLVLPHLEYACQLWSPADVGSIRKIKAVQRTFTSRLNGMRKYDYWQRLEALLLFSIERRRERYIIIYIWKMIQGIVTMVYGQNGSQLVVMHSERWGRLVKVPALRRTTVKVCAQIEASTSTVQ